VIREKGKRMLYPKKKKKLVSDSEVSSDESDEFSDSQENDKSNISKSGIGVSKGTSVNSIRPGGK